ncbi:MAG: hypothetical protein ACM30G_14865 [Micromonosporaceae bacterium]
MRIYAESAGIKLRQSVTDVIAVAWFAFWVWASIWVYDKVSNLAVPGQKIENAGTGMAGGLSDAGNKVGGVPAVGDSLSAPFERAAGAANALADAGRAQQAAVHNLAVTLVVLVLVVPVGLALLGYLPLRLRWMRRASLAVALRRRATGRDLLALRALTRQPLRRLLAIHPDPATAWRDHDTKALDSLAALELRALGLRGWPPGADAAAAAAAARVTS